MEKKVMVGICAMAKKSNSKPMKEIVRRLENFTRIQIIIFEEDVILNSPVEDWPIVNAFISFFSTGFPLDKAIAYKNLRQPFVVNDLDMQVKLQDRLLVVAVLRLFRKVKDRSSMYSHTSRVRRNGSYLYEDFMPTDGTDVKLEQITSMLKLANHHAWMEKLNVIKMERKSATLFFSQPARKESPAKFVWHLGMELRCVAALIRHGDRTPKQKMKMEVKNKMFFELFEKYGGFRTGHLKLKRPKQLQEVLDIVRQLLASSSISSDPDLQDKKAKLQQMKLVLEMYGHFSGINRKVQLKYQPQGRPKRSSEEEGV
nr:hypothetical protein BaRGS_033429 [Batillaria attramentaria]